MKTFLGRVARDLDRKLADRPELAARFERQLALAAGLLAQAKTDRPRVRPALADLANFKAQANLKLRRTADGTRSPRINGSATGIAPT